MKQIKGLITAPFTAFDETGALNTKPIPKYLEMLQAQGIGGVYVNGSSGEGYLMTDEERMENASAWIDASPKDFKVIVHVGSPSLRSCQKLSSHAEEKGAYATSVMGPTFPKIGRLEELVVYCEEVASFSPSLPFYYYHIPAFNGLNFSMVKLLEMVDGRISNFAGIKYTSESLYEYNQCRRYKDNKFDILHGQDETLLPSLSMGGAQGCIGGTFNYAASLYTGIVDAFQQGDTASAIKLQNKSQDMIDIIAAFRGNIVAGKQVMKLIGLNLGSNRAPFQNLTDSELSDMKSRLEAINFFSFANTIN